MDELRFSKIGLKLSFCKKMNLFAKKWTMNDNYLRFLSGYFRI